MLISKDLRQITTRCTTRGQVLRHAALPDNYRLYTHISKYSGVLA